MRRHNVVSDDPVTLIENRPTADQYLHLRSQTSWHPVSAREVETAMAGSLFSILAVRENRVVGCARIVGDGGLYFYIQDMIVDEGFRGQGIGSRMMRRLLQWLTTHCGDNAFVGLMAADGTAAFYRRFGFEGRGDGQPGMSMPGRSLPGKSMKGSAAHVGNKISPSK